MRHTPAQAITKIREVWRRAPRRWRQAVMVAIAVALPGSITASATAGMLPMGADRSSLDVLDGILPVQEDTALAAFLEPDHLVAVPVGGSSVAAPVRAVLSSGEVIETLGESGIPSVAVDAYMRAADTLAADDPTCGIRWTLLAAIGRVESNHGRFGGAQLRDDGYGTIPIRGIPLDGRPNVALIGDTDGGELDGDTTYDRAVGPMQFIPSTWRSVGVDANDDGQRDPDNIIDAAEGAAAYLCRGDADLRDPDARARAVRLYNNADEYVRVVLNLAETYESGAVERLPAIGLPPREPTPPPRPTPAPPQTAADPERPLTPGQPAAPPPPARPEVGGQPDPPAPTAPRPSPTTTTAPPSPPTTEPAPAPTAPPPPTPPPTAPPAPPTTSTTVPGQPPVTTPDDTVPPGDPAAPAEPRTDPPGEPVWSEPHPDVVAPPAGPPAAVGWAPAMREVVVEIIEQAPAAPAPAAPAPAAPAPAGPAPEAPTPPPPAAVDTSAAPPAECPPAEVSPGCPPSPAPAPAVPPAVEPPGAG